MDRGRGQEPGAGLGPFPSRLRVRPSRSLARKCDDSPAPPAGPSARPTGPGSMSCAPRSGTGTAAVTGAGSRTDPESGSSQSD